MIVYAMLGICKMVHELVIPRVDMSLKNHLNIEKLIFLRNLILIFIKLYMRKKSNSSTYYIKQKMG